MEAVVDLFANSLGKYMSAEAVVFIISMLPVLELRGGLIAAVLLGLPIGVALPLCIIGNIVPIPFLLLFISRILNWLKKYKPFRKFANWIESHAMKRSDKVAAGEFWGLAAFVGIPLPGTGAWTGSVIASLLKIDFKKAILAELLGVAIAAVIMSLISYGIIGSIV